jgi:UDPglucose--hexose-1-phosphate uridylyltransferase
MLEKRESLVWNPILRQYLVNAPHRMNRREGTDQCPFCADVEEGRISADARVWLHPNDFPPFRPPIGEAYVVIYHRDHHRTFTDLTRAELAAVTHLWRDLYGDLSRRYPVVMIFENSGAEIGQTQRHPHGQVYGVSVVPPLLEREMETVLLEERAGRGCPFCRVRAELEEGSYLVCSSGSWQAFLPPYVRYPYETHCYPLRHIANLAAAHDEELDDLGILLQQVIRGYQALSDGAMAPMPYMLGIHQLADERFHLHIEILAVKRAPGKLKHAASSEMLWQLWTNDSSPEQKAEELRQAIVRASHGS